MLIATFFIVLLPAVTVPTISSYDSFVFRNVLGVYSLMPTSLRHLFLKWTPVFDLTKYRKLVLLLIVLLNPNAPRSLRNTFYFLSDSRGPLGRFTRASLCDLKVPFPHSNSGKRTLAYSATKLLNDLSSDLKEFSISSSSLICKFPPASLKSKLQSLFLSRLSSAKHLKELLCSTCRYSINFHCFSYSYHNYYYVF